MDYKKVAIVHDELLRRGGAERVVISIHKLYPHADIYTAAYNPNGTFEYFKKCSIKTSFLNRFVRNEKLFMLLFFPFGILAFRGFNLSEYDFVIISSAHGAQYIRKPKNSVVINYAHYVFRLIWEPDSYSLFDNKFVNVLSKPVLFLLRKIDVLFNIKADYTIFNSQKTQKRYLEYSPNLKNYSIINPPVETASFKPIDKSGEFFLVVSRFEAYKKVDLVINTFKNLETDNLIIVGSGTQENYLKNLAKNCNNISFELSVSQERLLELYAKCKALIFPQEEDFGITPIECNASGRPVIALRKGGVLETMIEDETAIFFNSQTEKDLKGAIKKFKDSNFSQKKIIQNADRFGETSFHNSLSKIMDKYL